MSDYINDIQSFSFRVVCGNIKNIAKKLRLFKRVKPPKVNVYFLNEDGTIIGPIKGIVLDKDKGTVTLPEAVPTDYTFQIQYHP